jgi:large subunit ribosomal protein L22
MPKWGYSIIEEMLNPDKTAKASGRELKVSHKAAREVAKALKGKELAQAKDFLRDVIAKKTSPIYPIYKKLGHKGGMQNLRRQIPIKPPSNSCVFASSQANAENKGLDVDRLRICTVQPTRRKTKTLHAKSTRQSITKIRNHHTR